MGHLLDLSWERDGVTSYMLQGSGRAGRRGECRCVNVKYHRLIVAPHILEEADLHPQMANDSLSSFVYVYICERVMFTCPCACTCV